ncbi:SAYSvFN domain-containing protein 1 [Sarracenia purpurea var. burkii]
MQLSDLEYIHELLSKKVPYQEGQHETTILAVFLYAGIFSFDPTVSSNDGNLYLRIPNQEIYSYLTQQWVAKLAVSPTIFIGTKFPIMEYLLKDDDFHTLPEMTKSLSESLFQQAGCQRFGHVIIPTTNKKSKISELFTKNMLGNEKTIETLLAVTFQSALHSSSLKLKTVEQLSKASKSVDGSQDKIPRILDLMCFVEDITAVIIEIKYQKFQGENYNITEAFEQCISYSYLYRYCNTASVKFVKFLLIGVTETMKVDTRSVTISSSDLGAMMETRSVTISSSDLGAMMETRSVTISSSDLGAMMEISERKMKVDATNVITSSDLVTTMKTSEGKNNNKTDAKQDSAINSSAPLIEEDDSSVDEYVDEDDCDSSEPEPPAKTKDSSDENSVEESFNWIKFTVSVVVWICLFWYSVYIEFGAIFFILSCFYVIWTNTRTRPRKPNEISAYSVFNPNCERIGGTLDAKQLESEMIYGMVF